MLKYKVKLIQLKGLKQKFDKYYLHLNLIFQQKIDFLLQVDELTFNSLKSVVDFKDSHRYRLSLSTSLNNPIDSSLNNSLDPAQNLYTGTITETYREISNPISFTCSQAYTNRLLAIRNIESIDDLGELDFVHFPLYETPGTGEEEKGEGTNLIRTIGGFIKKHINRPRIKYITAAALIFAILFVYLGYNHLDSTIFNRRVLAQSVNLQDEANVEDGGQVKQPEDPPDAKEVEDTPLEDVASDETALPCISLNKTVSYSIPEGNVALTFDDGPSRYTENIIDILNKYEVGGTFFFIGYNAKQYPDQIKAVVSSGYSVGSHSMNHAKLSKLSYENQKYELLQSVKLIEEIIDRDINFFRPAYGSYTSKITDLIKEHQYKMVLWDIDPRDWESRDPDKIFDYIKNADVSGSIILLHESQATVDALPRIIEYLQGLDLQIVNLE